MIGMRLGIRHPERLTALGLLDTSARRDPPAKLLGYRGIELLSRIEGLTRPIGYRLAPIMFSDETIRYRPELVDEFVARLATMDAGAREAATEAVVFSRPDVSAELERIGVPTLVLCGAQDRATAPAESRLLAGRIPGAELVEVPGAGHLSALERPDIVNEALLRFLSGVIP
jgi:pimeloyl-ACP methyl ester carboxylesterase